MKDCIFCKMAQGSLSCHWIWEDERHLAFLSIYPNTQGATVVITKDHFPSYAFALPDGVLAGLAVAAKKVAQLLDASLYDVGRTAMVFEGFGVDHVHAKLFPLHGTKKETWQPIRSHRNDYFPVYEGYVQSNDSARADDAVLGYLAEQIRKFGEKF